MCLRWRKVYWKGFLTEHPADRMQLSKAWEPRDVNSGLGSNTNELLKLAPFRFCFFMQKLVRSDSQILSSFHLLLFPELLSETHQKWAGVELPRSSARKFAPCNVNQRDVSVWTQMWVCCEGRILRIEVEGGEFYLGKEPGKKNSY